MRGPAAFAAFERGLRDDHAREEEKALESLGIEPVVRRGPGRPPGKKNRKKPEAEKLPPIQRHMIGILPDLAQQLEHIAHALDTNTQALARIILGAGAEAIVRELETSGKLVIPLRLNVGDEPRGFYYQWIRTVTPARFENLRHFNAKRLERWRPERVPDDATGTPMPPPSA